MYHIHSIPIPENEKEEFEVQTKRINWFLTEPALGRNPDWKLLEEDLTKSFNALPKELQAVHRGQYDGLMEKIISHYHSEKTILV